MNRSSSVTAKVAFSRSCSSTAGCVEARRAVEGGERAVEPPLPAVRARERPRCRTVGGRERRQRAQALALARCGLERPGQRGERPAARPALDLVGARTGRASRPRTGSARAARRRRSRPRGRGRAAASAACRPCRRGSGRARPGRCAAGGPRARSARARPSAPRRGTASPASGAAGGPRRARPRRRPRSGGCARAAGRAPPRGRPRPRRRAAPGASASSETTSSRVASPPRSRQPSSSATSFEAASCARRSSRAASCVGGASSRWAALTIARARSRTAASGSAALRTASRCGSGWPRSFATSSSTRSGSVTPRPRSRPSRKSTWCAREPGVRRAQEREQVAPPPVEPGVAQQREQRLPERRLAEPQPPFERVGHAERREGRVERRAPALERRADDRDLVRRRAVAQQREDLVRDELERAADAGALEEAQRAVQLRALARLGAEERALQVGEHRRARLAARRELLDPPLGQPGEVVRGARERGEGVAAGLVRQRDGHLGARCQRLEQRPLGAGQVLEAVREHRPRLPGAEVAGGALGGVPALELAVPETEPVELLAVGAVELRELALQLTRLEQRGLELGHRRAERVGEAGEASGAALGATHDAPQAAASAAPE